MSKAKVSSQAGVQIGQQRGHLLIGKTAGEGRHQALACQDYAPNFGVGCGRAAGQRGSQEDRMQIRRDLLERQVVVLVAVGTADGVEVFAVHLLRSKGRLTMATGSANDRGSGQNRKTARAGDPDPIASREWFLEESGESHSPQLTTDPVTAVGGAGMAANWPLT